MKSKYLNIICFFLVCIFITACEKEEFITSSNEPVFHLEVPILNDDEISYTAGDDHYYMFASHDETEEEKIYSGLFGKDGDCTESCGENFQIQFHQKAVSQGKLETGNYPFYSVPKDGFKHNYSLISSEDGSALENATWKVGDQTHFGESLVLDSDNDTAPGDGIRLIYDVPGQFVIQMDRLIIPKTLECDIELIIDRVPNAGIFLEVKTSSPFLFVNWNTGENQKRIKIDFDNQSYSATVFDASGCQTTIFIAFKTQSLDKSYNIGFNQDSYSFLTPDNADNSVTISHTAADGVFYTSSVLGQILPFNFEVVDVSDYETNEKGDPTWKISANFDCILFSEEGSTKRIKEGKATFAVSY